jgi:hypothetical protein
MPQGNIEGVMFVGIDVYHQRNRNSVCAMVGTVNIPASKFKTEVFVHRERDEDCTSLGRFMRGFLEEWFKVKAKSIIFSFCYKICSTSLIEIP